MFLLQLIPEKPSRQTTPEISQRYEAAVKTSRESSEQKDGQASLPSKAENKDKPASHPSQASQNDVKGDVRHKQGHDKTLVSASSSVHDATEKTKNILTDKVSIIRTNVNCFKNLAMALYTEVKGFNTNLAVFYKKKKTIGTR